MQSVLFSALLALVAGTASAQSNEAYASLISALGEPGAVSCLDGAPAEQGSDVIETVMAAPAYDLDFTESDAADISARITKALAETGDAELREEYSGLSDPNEVFNAIMLGTADYGVFPEHAVDVTALYLITLWIAQEADFDTLGDEDRFAAANETVRKQVALAEGRCFALGGMGDSLRENRNVMLARIGFLIDATEKLSGSEAEAFHEYLRNGPAAQIEGLRLGSDGFFRP